jgi:hypothetical protein
MTTLNTTLADQAAALAERHEPRTPGRRAAAALHVALLTTSTTDGARRALGTLRDADTAAAALALLAELEQEAVPR